MVNMKIKRSIYKQLADDLYRPEVSIILGPRQVGKTFLLKELEGEAKARGLRTRYYNLELPHDLLAFNKDDRDLFRMLTDGLDADADHLGKRVAFRRLESLVRGDTDAWW